MHASGSTVLLVKLCNEDGYRASYGDGEEDVNRASHGNSDEDTEQASDFDPDKYIDRASNGNLEGPYIGIPRSMVSSFIWGFRRGRQSNFN